MPCLLSFFRDECGFINMSFASSYPYIQQAKEVLVLEANAIMAVGEKLDRSFEIAIETILQSEGRVIVTGMGKSGHIARKIAATLASTGTPAYFVHPAEAAHGDLGMILPQDVVIALSHSGQSDEVLNLLPALKRKGMKIIAMTGRPQSTLATEADIHLDAGVEKEACPLGLAPTSSTTAALALGDALAVVLLKARAFSANDFALSHPAGSLGKNLLVRVSDLMHTDNRLPQVSPDTQLADAIIEISEKGLGMVAVVDDNSHILGVFTDGDLRRLFQKQIDLKNIKIMDVMGQHPKTIFAHKLASEALRLMQDTRVGGLLVVDETGVLQGAINMHDLLQAGIV